MKLSDEVKVEVPLLETQKLTLKWNSELLKLTILSDTKLLVVYNVWNWKISLSSTSSSCYKHYDVANLASILLSWKS